MQIYYINADDKNKRAISVKQKLLASHGIQQLAPGWNRFEPHMLPTMLKTAINDGTASKTIIILDTLKKFADLLDTKSINRLNRQLENFAAAGGTVVATGHTNKNKDEHGKYIYKGTSDVRDDWHCAWLGTPLGTENGVDRTSFCNLKARGDVPETVTFTYHHARDDYESMFESVERVPADEEEQNSLRAGLIRETELHREVIDTIKESILSGASTKTLLIDQVRQKTSESKSHIQAILTQFTGPTDMGYLWRITKGKHNTHTYELN